MFCKIMGVTDATVMKIIKSGFNIVAKVDREGDVFDIELKDVVTIQSEGNLIRIADSTHSVYVNIKEYSAIELI